MKRLTVFILILTAFISSCTNNDTVSQKSSKDVDAENIYFRYRVWGDEESGIVTAKLQYLLDGENGSSLALDKPSKVEFDGKPVEPDSSAFEGAYYEVIAAAEDFAGRHIIIFTDENGREYKEEFDYPIITLKTKLPETVRRNDLLLEVAGLKENDHVRLLLTDTSFYGRGIEKMDTVRGGKISISKTELESLANGPIHLELFREVEREPEESTDAGGHLSVSYGLKREFLLEN